MSQVVQFTGSNKAVEAFINRDCNAWSIWSGKQFLFSYVGIDAADAANELQVLLDSLDKTGKGIYTLKIYDDVVISKRKGATAPKITDKTECHGSFNFKLKEFDPENDGGRYYNDLRDEIKTLKAERETLLSELDEPDDDEPQDMLGKIGAMFLADPGKLPLIISSIQNMLSMFTTQTKPTGQPTPVMLSGVNGSDPFLNVIESLKNKDANLLQHLQKLDKIATDDPATFKMLLSMLDSQ